MEGLVVSTDFWLHKKVFITGHTGFKGGWLSLWLQSRGADICGYALQPSTTPNLFNLADIETGMISITADIRDRDRLQTEMQAYQPDVVFHLAAQPLVRESYTDPINTYETNVMGTVNLFEAVRNTHSIDTVIIVTSDKCYENHEWPWGYRENDAIGGHDPYSSSKGCTELVTSAYRRSFFSCEKNPVKVASVRAGNVIGGGDWANDRLIPDMIRAYSQGKPAYIRAPQAIRPWQHVLEPLSGYICLAEQLATRPELVGGWNFGPDSNDIKPVCWLADRICENWGNNASWHTDSRNHPHEAGVLRLDCSKARAELDWSPKLRLADALELTTNWYKAYIKDENMRTKVLQQIQYYLNKEIS